MVTSLVRIGDSLDRYPVTDISLDASSTPMIGGDTSGGTGSMSVTVAMPDKYADGGFESPIHRAGIFSIIGEQVLATVAGVGESPSASLGEVAGVSHSGRDRAQLTLSVNTSMNDLNVHNLQTGPIVGTLGDAIREYLFTAGYSGPISVHGNLENIPVAFPGWQGELWYHLKMLAMAYRFDIVEVIGGLNFVPLHRTHIERLSLLDFNASSQRGTLAQYVDVVQQNNHAFANEPVYPPGGWTTDVPVLKVNAGEYAEEIIQLSSSVSTIQQPQFQTFVPREGGFTGSVYTVVGNDGLPVTKSAWEARGGSLHVTINPDTTSLTVHMRGPTGLPSINGGELASFGIALSSGTNDGDYSTLRIVGSGVAYLPEVRRIPTGVSESQTSTEVGETIDNPFLSDAEIVNRIGWSTASRYNGTEIKLSYSANEGGGEVWWQSIPQEMDPLAAIPYMAGARVWDNPTRRWYRVRNVSVSPEGTSLSADDDLTHEDMAPMFEGKTCQQVQDMYDGFTYRQIMMMGLRNDL